MDIYILWKGESKKLTGKETDMLHRAIHHNSNSELYIKFAGIFILHIVYAENLCKSPNFQKRFKYGIFGNVYIYIYIKVNRCYVQQAI